MSVYHEHILPRPVMRFERIEIDRIIVGKRQREADPDHVTRITDSFEQFRVQLQPLVCTEAMVLIDGLHRLMASRRLGWTHIDVGIASGVHSDDDRAFLEAEANAARKEMTISEKTELWMTIFKPRLTELAAKRRKGRPAVAGDTQALSSAKFAEHNLAAPPGEVRVLAQQYVQLSEPTMDKMVKMQSWAADESLDEQSRSAAKTGLERVDKIGKVDGVFKSVEAAVSAARTPPEVLNKNAAQDLVSRIINVVTLASQNLKKVDPQALVTALADDSNAAGDWLGVIAAATWILNFAEDAAADAGIRTGTR